MNHFLHLLGLTGILLVSCKLFAQNEFYNKGAEVYIQKGALVHIQGELVNDNSTTNGEILNDGIIEVKTDFENKTGAKFKIGTDSTSTDRAVKFIGNGNQKIKGTLNTTGSASFYNLVIDKAVTSDTIEMLTDVTIEGSLVFNSTNTTSTYNPTSTYTTYGNKGLLKSYDNSEYLLRITNGATDAIAGYAPLLTDSFPITGFVLTKGTKASNAGGLLRRINTTDTYVFPIGTDENGYNAIALHLSSIPTGGADIKGKFVDGSSNIDGYIGNISDYCNGCGTWPQNRPGYNRYFSSNSCNAGAEQWFILNNSVIDHGYWSFDATGTGYQYWMEAFPNSFRRLSIDPANPFRLLRYPGPYDLDPSGAGVDWRTEIENVVDIEDLLTYTANMGCYSGTGVPGGRYTSFSHFGLGSASEGSALPIELLYLKAEPVNNQYISVKWATAVEINNMGFEVWRSTDAINFTKIGWVDGKGNSTTTQTYQLDDTQVQPNIVYYYKLRQFDYDGTATESYLVNAMITANSQIVIGDFFPNPSESKSSITIYSPVNTLIQYKLYDAIGRIVLEGRQEIVSGQNMLPFNLTNLAAATYNAAIMHENKIYSRRLVIQK